MAHLCAPVTNYHSMNYPWLQMPFTQRIIMAALSNQPSIRKTTQHDTNTNNPTDPLYLRPSPVTYPIFIPYLYYIYPIHNRINKV